MKITYGTGVFMMANIGNKPIIHPSLITTILYKYKDKIQYAFECSVECGGGTLNWAKRAGFFDSYHQLNELESITHLPLYFFPTFGDIYAPFWRTGVKGGLVGLSLLTNNQHILAALL